MKYKKILKPPLNFSLNGLEKVFNDWMVINSFTFTIQRITKIEISQVVWTPEVLGFWIDETSNLEHESFFIHEVNISYEKFGDTYRTSKRVFNMSLLDTTTFQDVIWNWQAYLEDLQGLAEGKKVWKG